MGMPIDAPNEEWTWVPFSEAVCANGQSTGIGVNLTDKSKRVLLYFEGGGACWDQLTCYLLKTAANFDTGYDEAKFQSELQQYGSALLFNRTAANNPFKDYNYVFIPYCTGDVHAGDNEADYGGNKAMHKGGANVLKYLERLVPTFAGTDRVIASGSSAGGYGAGFNWWRIQNAFGSSVRVDLLDDSGQPLPPPYITSNLEQQWRTQWNLGAALPPDCAECANSLDALFSYYGDHMTNQRAALISYTRDTVISQFLQISLDQFEQGLDVLATTRIDPYPKMHYFFVTGESHVLLGSPTKSTNGVTVLDWVTQMESDDPAWTSQHP